MANLRLWSPMEQLVQDLGNMSKFLEVPNVPVLFKGGEPKVDIVQTDKEVIIMADVPGVKKEDMHVTVTEDTITFQGEAKSSTETKKEDYFHSERFYGCYSRTLPLPVLVDSAHAKAKFEDGVLTVTIPKASKPEKGTAVTID
ncbi:MAG: Hsp20/alpha crystallin family protein [Veillonellaceae bacterium]|nr:Hsp20/alpha crystallin family protein [Veillonellaceae bacterium]